MRHIDVSAYVDGQLRGSALCAAERHLVCCEVCRHAVVQEQRIIGSLRSASCTAPPPDLHAMLMSVASIAPAPSPARPPSPTPLPVLPIGTPARHRSALRTMVCAGFAVGASAAAAWGAATAATSVPRSTTNAPASPQHEQVLLVRPGPVPGRDAVGSRRIQLVSVTDATTFWPREEESTP